ncbi:dioxygenase family protein [Adhaeribacter pallidiroseus]|uniref:Protocatechuate 3,4-dioxygenase n=1 Tax=Adhaeribacter pallidiroseus TaxID=2072847 RepID=A0A369QHS3_9BACT|nr:intradiol ring-cleavage dioxygenase [Adhaeribacter pallidiroseus]RDC64274.1 Protocatechuate 3,4-dioxygenase [Adhaeribacter pallidiroseus]
MALFNTSRRKFLALIATLPLFGLWALYPKKQAVTLIPTPACDDHDEPTPSQTEGPYFKPESPERRSFMTGSITGTKLIVSGQVLNTNCQPVAKALLDWWHADDAGNYDNTGFKLRGHQYTDQKGNFYLETIVPGLYPGRTRHLHVKVQAPGQQVLTTQLYFPNEAKNTQDGIFNQALTMHIKSAPDKLKAHFDFVLVA